MSRFLRRLSSHIKRGSHSDDSSTANDNHQDTIDPAAKGQALSLKTNGAANGTNGALLAGRTMSASPVQTRTDAAQPANGAANGVANGKAIPGVQAGNGLNTREKIEAERAARGVHAAATVPDKVGAQAQVGEAQRQAAAAAATSPSADTAGVAAVASGQVAADPTRTTSVESVYARGYVKAELVDDQIRNSSPRLQKRLVVFCDGTWQDGTQSTVQTVTNVLRLARCVLPEDFSTYPPIPQIVYYQSGLGTTDTKLTNITQGATGAGIVAKIREAYTFIAQNFLPGDEIFLFGFSRGAYTARMIAALIGDLGVLPRTEMENFYTIFKAYQARGSDDEEVRANATAILDPIKANLKLYQDGDEGKWGIRCVGVFDTVGALGIPGLNSATDPNFRLLGFIDTLLGNHIAHAFHALALDEPREDFTPTKWIQTNEGKQKNQVLEQVWFSGAHTDVGGGYKAHDLADLTLAWMMSNLLKHNLLALDVPYFYTIPRPHAIWGTLKPHDPRASGFMVLSIKTKRKIPEEWDEQTQEYYHFSTANRECVQIHTAIHPELVAEAMPLEVELREWWSHQAISKSYDEAGHGGIFSNLFMLVKDAWDGDEPDDTASGNVTKAQSRHDALDAVRGAPDTEGLPPPMSLSSTLTGGNNSPPAHSVKSGAGNFFDKAKTMLHEVVDEIH